MDYVTHINGSIGEVRLTQGPGTKTYKSSRVYLHRAKTLRYEKLPRHLPAISITSTPLHVGRKIVVITLDMEW